MNGNIKIFVSHHKTSKVISNDIIIPIQVGANDKEYRLDMISDDTGDNISDKNDKYCELTAIYWAWKNVDADYYGFSHYRRYFIFKEINAEEEYYGKIKFEYLNDSSINYCGMDVNSIQKALEDCDIVLPMESKTSKIDLFTNQIHYAGSEYGHIKDYNVACEAVKKLYPNYSEDVDCYNVSNKALWYNMFIFDKKTFFEYCEWLFKIIDCVDKKIDYTFYSAQERRAVAFLAERLLGIYITHLKRVRPTLRIKYLKVAFFKDVESTLPILPAFQNNNIPVTVSVDEKYVPFLGVMLHSLLTNADKNKNYDIMVLHKKENIASSSKRLLEKTISEFKNSKIRFIDVSQFADGLNFYVTKHFSIETYFRLFLPKILTSYNKIIYLDADMVVMSDISSLYDRELGENSIAAVHDIAVLGALRKHNKVYTNNINKLELMQPLDYFQAGLLVMDLDSLRKDDLFQEMISYAASHECKFVDQDVLNRYLQGKVEFLEQRWNVEISSGVMNLAQFVPSGLYQEYMEARNDGYIYHFCGELKPWNNLNIDYSEIFWTAARKTIWYETILETFISDKTAINRIPKYEPIYRELAKESKYVSKSLVPIIKALNELAEIGLSEHLIATIKSLDENIMQGESLILYGAGINCRKILTCFDELGIAFPAQIWDKSAKQGQHIFGISVVKPDFESLRDRTDMQCIITIINENISNEVKQIFIDNRFNNVIDERSITSILSAKMWLKLEEKLNSNKK